jgi:FlaG/FlaF family flagellin (archaellin)
VRGIHRAEADSEIQGAILMLAITVIIAAVVASFAFGAASSVTKPKTVAAIAEQIDNDIVVTWYGGVDNDFVSSYNLTLLDTIHDPGTMPGYPPVVGNTTRYADLGTTGNDHVVVVAFFTDGTVQVVMDAYV